MSNAFGRNPFMMLLGALDAGSATAGQVDSTSVYETSGESVGFFFTAKRSQSAATLTVYIYSTTHVGTPDWVLDLRNAATAGQDPDGPETAGSVVASSGTVSTSTADNNTWLTFTITCSLTAGASYWLCLRNTHGTPASNYASWVWRGALDGFVVTDNYARFVTWGVFSSDSWATKGTPTARGVAPIVMKYSDGTIEGMPYVSSTTPATDANDRGNRFTFPFACAIHAVAFPLFTDTDWSGIEINAAVGGANLGTFTLTPTTFTHSKTGTFSVSLSANQAVDYVATFGGTANNGTIYGMGEIEANVPADVLACRPPGAAFVTGATPGSYTVDTSQLLGLFALQIEDITVSAGGGAVQLVGGGLVG